MATDNITGIRIGDNTYQEGLRYRNVELGLFLLPPQDSSGARVRFDITGRQLTITLANRQGRVMGQFTARGRAVGAEASGGIASDFLVKRVVERLQTRNSSGRQLLRGQATAWRRFSFNAAQEQVNSAAGPLPRDTWRTLVLSDQSSSGATSFSRGELNPQPGSPFAGDWGAAVV